ncbi:MAG: SIS domain-containing protein [Acidobacteria bacterium]|nr:SIS domain-containing protein [Acidobacteriota bacterium]
MDSVSTYKQDLLSVIGAIDTWQVRQVIQIFEKARDNGNTIFVCGNGGSAASASHFVCDVLKGASFGKEKKFRILSLNDNFPTLTAYANDVGYDVIFSEQLKNFGRQGDVFLAISGSGNSPNVVKGMETANAIGCETIAFTGRDGGKLGPMARHHIHIANPHMGRIEDAHMVMCHMIAYHFMEN